jgi:LysR family transcriptional regulator, hypochlorite-specific transcription factor HypT
MTRHANISCPQQTIKATLGGGLLFTSHLAATLLTMAREGHGVAWLPLTLAAEDLTHARLVRAGPKRFNIPIEIRLFRAYDCRNHATDALWSLLNKSPTNHVD